LVSATLITNILSAIFITHAWTGIMGIQSILTLLGVGIFFLVAKRQQPAQKIAKVVVKK